MSMDRVMGCAWALPFGLLLGCSLPTAQRGVTCQRSTQCAAGLACVSGRCGDDLSAIAATNTVPQLTAGSAADDGSDAGPTDAP